MTGSSLIIAFVLLLGALLQHGACQGALSAIEQKAKAKKLEETGEETFGSPPAEPYAEAINSLGLDLLREARLTDGLDINLVYSPLSISAAFSLLHLGAKGSTKAELEDVFGFEEAGVSGLILEKIRLSAKNDAGSLVANKAFVQEGMDINEDYIAKVKEDNIAPLDFLKNSTGARDAINAFVEDATNGLIKEPLEEGAVDPSTVLVVVNAIFFRQAWKAAFPRSLTDTGEFIAVGRVQEVDFMGVNDREVLWRSVPELDAQAVEFPYENEEFSMIIVLPNTPEGYRDAETNLNRVITGGLLFHGFKNRFFDKLRIPKFELAGGLPNLKEHLQRMGLVRTFTSSDFSGISTSNLALSDVVHKAKIKVDEKGTTAAAVTAGILPKAALVSEFIVEHPFLFFIVEKPAGVIWFQGTVTQF